MYQCQEDPTIQAFYKPYGEFAEEIPSNLRSFLDRLKATTGLPHEGTEYPTDNDSLRQAAVSFITAAGEVFGFSLGLDIDDARYSPLPGLREVQRWGRLAERFAHRFPGDNMAVMLRAGLFRKAGMFDKALATVRPIMESSPNWHAATALGLILRQQGKVEEAEQAFEKALSLDPDDISARLEAGDTYFERGQWQRALKWYENVLSLQPQHPWAAPSATFCRWRLTNEDRYLHDRLAMAKGEPANDRARNLYVQGISGGLSEPVDATANLLRQFRQKVLEDRNNAPSGEAKMTLTSLEAPSNFLAFRMEMESLRHDLRLQVSVNRVPSPDPRKPLVEGSYVLWEYDGTDPLPPAWRP